MALPLPPTECWVKEKNSSSDLAGGHPDVARNMTDLGWELQAHHPGSS